MCVFRAWQGKDFVYVVVPVFLGLLGATLIL